MQMQTMLQELRLSPGINPAAVTSQERPEIGAIRQALLSGDKLKAIKLYRSVYGVGLREAQEALDAM
jgi:ribosomal protein L7/L12